MRFAVWQLLLAVNLTRSALIGGIMLMACEKFTSNAFVFLVVIMTLCGTLIDIKSFRDLVLEVLDQMKKRGEL